MNLTVLHRRLLRDVLEIGNAFPLVLTGGYAVQAHRIVDRFSRDIDMATDSAAAMEVIVTTVIDGLTGRGWQVEVIGVDTHGARMMATDPGSEEQCELDILRESFSQPPESTPWGPVLALDDVIGTKVRALAGRGLPRDLIDIHAASRLRTTTELESLGRRHAWDEWALEDLKFRLDGADWYDDQAFAEYGLGDDEIADLRRWAQAWSDDLNRRLYGGAYSDDGEDDEDEGPG
jgi:predicted nucleotidyltransferase component of viral defense system